MEFVMAKKINFDKLSKAETFEIFEQARKALDAKQNDENVKRMRKASGNINDDRTLVCFLYLLMRDAVTPGKMEQILLSISNINDKDTPLKDKFQLTNGWLAQYAQDIADRIETNLKTGSAKK